MAWSDTLDLLLLPLWREQEPQREWKSAIAAVKLGGIAENYHARSQSQAPCDRAANPTPASEAIDDRKNRRASPSYRCGAAPPTLCQRERRKRVDVAA